MQSFFFLVFSYYSSSIPVKKVCLLQHSPVPPPTHPHPPEAGDISGDRNPMQEMEANGSLITSQESDSTATNGHARTNPQPSHALVYEKSAINNAQSTSSLYPRRWSGGWGCSMSGYINNSVLSKCKQPPATIKLRPHEDSVYDRYSLLTSVSPD